MNVEAEYNMGKLKERLKAIEESFMGLRTPVSTFVCDENGEVSDEKITELADRVISCECNLFGRYIGISGPLKRYYEVLFYLLFRTYDPHYEVLHFGDILKVTEELQKQYENRDEFLLREAGRMGGHRGFFFEMRRSCKLLGGNPVTEGMAEEELDEMERPFQKRRAPMAQSQKESEKEKAFREEICDRYSCYGIEGYDSYWDALDNEYFYKYPELGIPEEDRDEEEQPALSYIYDRKQERYLTVTEACEYRSKEKEREEAWIKSIEDPQKYLDAYREFCDLNWIVNVIDTKGNLTDHILDILQEAHLNKIGDDDKFLRLYGELNRCLKLARHRI